MASRHDRDSRPGDDRNPQIRRDTAVRGSMGTPGSGRDESGATPDSDSFQDESPSRERMRARAEEMRRQGKMPLPE
jgi:hypothetical protein